MGSSEDFGDIMEDYSEGTSHLASELLDSLGCLRNDFIDHPVKKGSGVWGRELHRGHLLFIEDFVVAEGHRRQGHGRKLAQKMWDEAQKVTDITILAFAIVWPAHRHTGWFGGINVEELGYNPKEVAEAFWRALGYRRVGASKYFAKHEYPEHPSFALAASDNYRGPVAKAKQVFYP